MSYNIDSDRVAYGRNNDLGTWKDNRYVKCARCGFVCHLDRDRRGHYGSREGWGMSYAPGVTFDQTTVYFDSSETTSSSVTVTNVKFDGYTVGGLSYDIDTRTGGCPFCGTLMYDI